MFYSSLCRPATGRHPLTSVYGSSVTLDRVVPTEDLQRVPQLFQHHQSAKLPPRVPRLGSLVAMGIISVDCEVCIATRLMELVPRRLQEGIHCGVKAGVGVPPFQITRESVRMRIKTDDKNRPRPAGKKEKKKKREEKRNRSPTFVSWRRDMHMPSCRPEPPERPDSNNAVPGDALGIPDNGRRIRLGR